MIMKYKEKEFKSVSSGDLGIEAEEDKEAEYGCRKRTKNCSHT